MIDDDLGRSGASMEGRPGFQRLVAEVGLGQVGLVLGAEMSRLARSCRDWHQLLEICALFDTLIADADGVYDAGKLSTIDYLLGLKGTMSEAELHIHQSPHVGRQARQGAAGRARDAAADGVCAPSCPARLRWIRTSRPREPSAWCLTCSSGSAPSAR